MNPGHVGLGSSSDGSTRPGVYGILIMFVGSYQNENSLLVKRQTDNTTPGGWGLTGGD